MLNISRLLCDQNKNFIGLDNRTPVFSWMIESDGIDISQSSYEIEVSRDADFKDQFWNSSVIQSDQSQKCGVYRTVFFSFVQILDESTRYG